MSPLCFISIIKITSIQDYKYFRKKRISKYFSGFLPLLKSIYDKLLIHSIIDDSITDLFRSFIIKYKEKNLQKIIKTVLKAHVSPSNKFCKKRKKAKLSNMYYGKSHIKYYKFCQ